MNSRGSVVPIFLEQIKKGGPVTITNPEMTRFMMTIPEAVEFILYSAEISMGREIFIKKMKSVRICDLAEAMIEHFAPAFGYNPKDIKIEVMGERDGEKMDEELFSTDEIKNTYENDDIYVVLPHFTFARNPDKTIVDVASFSKIDNRVYTSNNASYLNKSEIIQFFTDKCN
jgi:FlaA1/EpsC-like NDP-sugar epimerase